ncbi:MAG: division/cell wall cluster transcriptional repressor MraZ [Acidobacteriota bacterium]
MLDGSFTAKVDEKGRVKIPSDFRRQILEQFDDRKEFFVTSAKGDYAHVYPISAWREIQRKLKREPNSRVPVRKYRRATSYFGRMATMDPQGRILLHPTVRSAAGIKDDVLIIGEANHLGVWNLRKFMDVLRNERLSPEDEDYLAELGI